jgi:hypothetical protein
MVTNRLPPGEARRRKNERAKLYRIKNIEYFRAYHKLNKTKKQKNENEISLDFIAGLRISIM